MSKQELTRRYLFFIAGLYVNSLGISLITKAELGTSPISSIPYTLSIGFPLSLGMFTLFYSLLLIVISWSSWDGDFPGSSGFSCRSLWDSPCSSIFPWALCGFSPRNPTL